MIILCGLCWSPCCILLLAFICCCGYTLGILLDRTSIIVTVFVQGSSIAPLLLAWVYISVITCYFDSVCAKSLDCTPTGFHCFGFKDILLFSLFMWLLHCSDLGSFCWYISNLGLIGNRGRNRSSVGCSVADDLRDTQSKYSGDPMFLQSSNQWVWLWWVLY